MVPEVLGILLVAALFGLAWWWWRHARGGGPHFPCRTCRHCRRLDPDGAMCAFGARQVWKNPAQIAMCPDHAPRRTRR